MIDRPEAGSREVAGRFSHAPGARGATIRTFHPRRSVLGRERTKALTDLWPRYGFSVHDDTLGTGPVDAHGLLDTVTLFGRLAPVVLDIGPGMGVATAQMAAADPERDYLAVEAHLPGVAQLLVLVDRGELHNVRVVHGDALRLLDRIAPDSLDAIHVFFPDPWPKARHHKRRLITAERAARLRAHLRVGGTLHCATDWAPYAEQMLAVFEADAGLRNLHGGPAPRPQTRPLTAFEKRGIEAGRTITDVIATRTR